MTTGDIKKARSTWLPWPCWCRTLQIHRSSYTPQETKKTQTLWVGPCEILYLAYSSFLFPALPKRSNIMQVHPSTLPWAMLEPHQCAHPCLFEVASDCQQKISYRKPRHVVGSAGDPVLHDIQGTTVTKGPVFFGDEKQRCKSWTGDAMDMNCVGAVWHAMRSILFNLVFFGGVENLYALQSSRHIFAQRQDHWGPQCTLEQS